MRYSVVVFLLVNVALIVYAVASVWTLLSLLVVDGAADALVAAELDAAPWSAAAAAAASANYSRVDLIPRIIHQTYIDDEQIPPEWKRARQSCLALHTPEEGWEYQLWTDALSREFVATEYPWFLAVFDGYRFPIQRADAIRYLVLAHFGGIYIDLDVGCHRKLDPLLAYPAWVRRTVPTGISNDVMGSVPQHPFFLRAIDALTEYNRNWLLPYITVMASTGPLFLSLVWRHYNTELDGSSSAAGAGGFASLGRGTGNNNNNNNNGVAGAVGSVGRGANRVRLLLKDQYMGNETSFFSIYQGSSWHKGDAKLVFWMRDHWGLLLLLGLVLAYLVFSRSWRGYRRLLRRCRGPSIALDGHKEV
ncbi:Glycosyltransferase, DXD sugar-binding motif protein [Niveomyces insectorum RCEF 264]|uniref:Glycosyltransferase, DXD sugar-binding motif protein n=1 Tax=Niveomyces insectorum RCEF 264 TaxID=1081102 RepID=A0A162J495_9HYPO|nr:Glycosyltransferase, DXD sugar-binding motif protein [Niveomyces insectorum RCEF 264]